jgi:hypothetical protein
MVARLVECSDYNMQYGILTVENASLEEVQNKIYEIKKRFYDEGFDDWTLDDVFMEFPEEWEWDYVQADNTDIIEI